MQDGGRERGREGEREMRVDGCVARDEPEHVAALHKYVACPETLPGATSRTMLPVGLLATIELRALINDPNRPQRNPDSHGRLRWGTVLHFLLPTMTSNLFCMCVYGTVGVVHSFHG